MRGRIAKAGRSGKTNLWTQNRSHHGLLGPELDRIQVQALLTDETPGTHQHASLKGRVFSFRPGPESWPLQPEMMAYLCL